MRIKYIAKQGLWLILLNIPFCLFSQQSVMHTNATSDFNSGLELYQNKAYRAAQKIFTIVENSSSPKSNLMADASYFNAMCGIKLNQTDADKKVLTFVENYPASNKKNKAFFNVANYYFANKKAAHALKWYQKINLQGLSKENQKEINFKMGYSLLVAKRLDLAKDKFLPLINDAKYGNDSRYYYGYISYKLEDYGIAESTLKEIADNDSYKAEISYYLLDISFKAGSFERCIKVGKELLKTAKRKEASEISKIIGESYFNLNNYKEAIPYLMAYKGKSGKWNNTDYYQLGYAFYKQNDFINAVSYFNKIIDQQNAVAQNAYYHLAECYLNVEKKNEALNAFKTASEMSYNLSIKEDATLNYAKLSYEEGNPFENVSDVLQNYLKAYPNSKSYTKINELVVSSFIHQNDYKGALDYLKKKKTNENINLSLEVSLYRGIQLFNEKKIAEALSYFTIAKKSKTNEISKKAGYWEAETLYRLENYDEALSKFINLNNNLRSLNKADFPLLEYNIAYCHFKLKDYDKAALTFNQFLTKKNIDQTIIDDTYLRLGDSYFAIRNYSKAIIAYTAIVDNSGLDADYAMYQIGMSYGFQNNNESKVNALIKVINNYQISSLKDDALFQLAITYTKLNSNEKAHLAYNRLLEKYPKSIFIPRALVREGLLYYNQNENSLALKNFKKVAKDYPNSSDALEAVRNAKNIYVDEDKLNEFIAWTKTLNFIEVLDSELENSTFIIAERKYFEGKNEGGILSLKKYLRNFPKGKNSLKANYYLADILFKEALYNQSIDEYKRVLEAGQTEFSEDALAKLSLIYLQDSNFNDAEPYLLRLEQEAYSSENILFTQSNLMMGYANLNRNEAALNYAKKVLSKDKLDNEVILDAKTIIARTAFKTEDFITARKYFNTIEQTAEGELKAETLYYKSYFLNAEKQFENSTKIIQELIANYSNYKYWGVKSYIIMAKNYYSLEDAYQATFILENIIKNFGQFEDIVIEAKQELKTIKENEAKTNNSVTPKNK